MTIEEFIAKHDLRDVDQCERYIPEELCPPDDVNHDLHVYLNEEETVGLAVDLTKQRVRLLHTEPRPGTSDWMPIKEFDGEQIA